MATIGNSPKYANYAPEYFTGNGSETAFITLYNIASAASVFVVIDGIKQLSNTYTVNGNTINFSEAPPNGAAIEIINLAAAGQVNTVADNTVSTSKLVDANVTLEKMAPNSVGNTNLVDSSVSTKKLNFDTGSFSFRNKIIGGDFSTNPWQRGTSFPAVTNAYTADRWGVSHTSGAVISVNKGASVPSPEQAGIYVSSSISIPVGVADTSIASGEFALLQQKIEGYNISPFGFGKSGTRYVTLSFWHGHVKSGTYYVSFSNSDASRSYVAPYTQSVSDTWEYSSISIPVDTSGTWDYTNGVGLNIRFVIATGSTYITTANSWQSGNYLAASNQVNGLDSTSNNFRLALVQLESGDVATPFEIRSFQQELQLCQRYYEKSYDVDTPPGTISNSGIIATYSGATGIGGVRISFQYKQTKRASATVIAYSGTTGASGVIRDESGADRAAIVVANGTCGATLSNNVSTNAAGHNTHFTASAEL
jgi:hypothetical protein